MTNASEQANLSAINSLDSEIGNKRTQKAAPKKPSTRKPIQLKERAHATFIEQKAICGYAEKTNEEFVLYLLQSEQNRRVESHSFDDLRKKENEESSYQSQDLVSHWKSRCDALAERLSYVEQLLSRTELIASNSWKQKIKMEEEWKMCQATLHEMALRESDFKAKLYDMEKRLKVALDSDTDKSSYQFSANNSHVSYQPTSSSSGYNFEFNDLGMRLMGRSYSEMSGSGNSDQTFSPTPTLPIIPVEFTRNLTPVTPVNSADGVLKLEPKGTDESDTFFGQISNSIRNPNVTCFIENEAPATKKMKLNHGVSHGKHDEIELFFSSIAFSLDEI